MTTSGTTSFAPSNADIVLEAFSRCGIRPPAITNQHMVDARMSLNMALTNWDNYAVNLWKVDLVSVDLIEGVSEYDVDADTILILDAYIRLLESGSDTPTDRILTPISRTDYAVIPNKTQVGFPTTFWFDRTVSPTITIWQPPSATGIYTLRYYRMTRIEDASPTMGQTPDVPFRFFDALAAELASRLAEKYAPEREAALAAKAEMKRNLAMEADREHVAINILPDLTPYYNM